MALFGNKKNKKEEEKTDTPAEFGNVGSGKQEEADALTVLPKEYGVLKGFYVSEKATSLSPLSQYVFKVFDNATKSEVKKQVENNFNVKVKEIKTINLPKKSRNIGRYPGFKSGFKKAIVVLEKGQSIEQAKA